MSFGQFMSKRLHSKVNMASDFCKIMDKISEGAVIQYLHKKGIGSKDTHTDIEVTKGNAPSYNGEKVCGGI